MLLLFSLPAGPPPEGRKVDENWFVLIEKGDRDAFEKLYLATDRAVYALLLSLLKNPQEAEDAMQDTYVRIREVAHCYRPQGKPLAWIFTVAKNIARMRLRQGERAVPVDPAEWRDEVATAESDPDDRLTLQTALAVLGEDERQVVLLHAAGYKQREIATALGLPLSTVLSKHRRALAKMRRALEGDGGKEESR